MATHAPARSTLQHNHASGRLERALAAVCLATAILLLVFGSLRLLTQFSLGAIPALALIAAAWVLADFLSGLVHWAADTWGRVDTPWIGRRFLHPFRVHHVNPRDILGRGFLDLNGDVAMLTLPLFAAATALPLDAAPTQAAALLMLATAGWLLPTNQIHQWAHRAQAPRPVRALQRAGLVLSREAHSIHHRNPAGGHYGITSGCCNRWLARIDFYACCERLVSHLTGLAPREEGVDAWREHASPPMPEAPYPRPLPVSRQASSNSPPCTRGSSRSTKFARPTPTSR